MAFVGSNIDDVTYTENSRIETFRGRRGSRSDKRRCSTNLLSFNAHTVKEHINHYIKYRPECAYQGLEGLERALRNHVLIEGHIIFQQMFIQLDESGNGYLKQIYGMFYGLLYPLVTVDERGTTNSVTCYHSAVYVGNGYVVDNGKDGEVKLRVFKEAFEEEETQGKCKYFIFSAPKDNRGRSTGDLVCQKALASIGVNFNCCMDINSTETFAIALLYAIQNTYIDDSASTTCIDNVSSEQGDQWFVEIRDQIAKVPTGITLTLDYYLIVAPDVKPWFIKMLHSYDELFEAARNGDEKKCLSLLNLGLVSSSTDSEGYTPLTYAAENGNTTVCLELVKHKVPVNETDQNEFSALICAVRSQHGTTCQKLVKCAGADVHQENIYGETALIIVAKDGSLPMCTVLLELGANINYANCSGYTALMAAAENGHLSTCELLIKAGATVSQVNHYGDTALMRAAQNGHSSTCQKLIKYGAAVNQGNYHQHTSLMLAAQNGHLASCAVLINCAVDVNWESIFGYTALMLAALNSCYEVCEELIIHGADVNQGNQYGETALILAAQKGYLDVTNLLINNGADVNQVKNSGYSPLMLAAINGHFEVCSQLLKQGAKIDQKNLYGETALMLSSRKHHHEICKALINSGGGVIELKIDERSELVLADKIESVQVF